MDTLSFDWTIFGVNFLKIASSFLLALPIAWEREQSTRIMGLRTFPLVAIASCGYVLIATATAGLTAEAQVRLIQGLMSGIGFIGGGAILKEGTTVRGTATAASIWTTGALGAAVAFNRYEIALLLSVTTYLTLRILTPIEEQISKTERAKSKESEQR